MANVVLVISYMGGGKTYFTKQFIKKTEKRNLIYDVNQEYNEISGSKSYYDFTEFMQKAEDVTDTNLIFEDATGELSGKAEKSIKRLIVAKRHRRNNLIFLFHSIEDTPPFLFRMANYVVLFKTGDLIDSIERKAPYLKKSFEKLQNMNFLYDVNGKRYSPKLIIKKM